MPSITGPIPLTRPDLDQSDQSHPYSDAAREIASAASWAAERVRVTNPIPVLAEAQEALRPDEDRTWATATDVLETVADRLRHLDDAPETAALQVAGHPHRKPGPPDTRPAHAGRHETASLDDPVILWRARGLAAVGLPGWCRECRDKPCRFHAAMQRRAIALLTRADHAAALIASQDGTAPITEGAPCPASASAATSATSDTTAATEDGSNQGGTE